MRLALYQPEIPYNTGTIIRLGACLGVAIDIIEPTGFVWSDKKLQRAGMDYIDLAQVKKHVNWESFCENNNSRIVLLDTKAKTNYWDFSFQPTDVLLVGKESSGVPEAIFHSMHHIVKIPMQNNTRSLNVAVAAAMVLSEGLRQTSHRKF